MSLNKEYYTKPMKINNKFLDEVRKEKVMCQDLRDFMKDVVNKEDGNEQKDIH